MRRLVVIAAAAMLAAGCSEDTTTVLPPVAADGRTEPPPFTPEPEPEPASAKQRPEPRYLLATLERPAPLRAAPNGRVLTRLATRTEFDSPMVLGVLEQRRGWLKVHHPALTNDQRGWINARTALLHGTDYAIHVDRKARRATLRRDGKAVFRFPVAVGRPGNETPLGRFAVTDKLRTNDGSSPYGCCALALSGHQTKLEPGWPGGDRLAIHGTPAVETIGQAASLGCMRADASALHRLLRRIPLGAPVFIARS